MENITVEIQNEEEKKVLVTFLESLDYKYRYTLNHQIINDESANDAQTNLSHYATE